MVICTAIGKITAMYYVLHLYTDYGCCANKAEAQLHIVFHSRTPMIVKPQLLPQPANWYPKNYPKVVYQGMSPYLYSPDPRIPFVNQPGQVMADYSGMNTSSQGVKVNPMLEEMSESWGNGPTNWNCNGYQPVFYDEGMVTDAQR